MEELELSEFVTATTNERNLNSENSFQCVCLEKRFANLIAFRSISEIDVFRSRMDLCSVDNENLSMKYFSLIAKMFKANLEAKRILTIDEFLAHEQAKIDSYERNLFLRAVANLSIGWAQVEILLDYANFFLINEFEVSVEQLPNSLRSKIAFFKQQFREVSKLRPFADRAHNIVERANILKETRHDIIHGIAERQARDGIRQFIRHSYKGKRLIEQKRSYTLDQILKKNEEIADLAEDMVLLLKEVVGPRLPELFAEAASCHQPKEPSDS